MMSDKEKAIILGYDVDALKKNIERHRENIEVFKTHIKLAEEEIETLQFYIKMIEEARRGANPVRPSK